MVFRRSVFIKMFINLTAVLMLFSLVVVGGTLIFLNRDKTNRIMADIENTAALSEQILGDETAGKRERIVQLAEYRSNIIIIYRNGVVDITTANADFDIESLVLETHVKTVNGAEIYRERSRVNDAYYMMCRKEVGTVRIEVRQNIRNINESLQGAQNVTIMFVMLAFAGAMIWAVFYSMWFTAPITEMNKVTREIAKLNFTEKVRARSNDEVGELASSINAMSGKLSTALSELSEKNELLIKELEHERSLDLMRKKFVSDVSHELKTPLAIIQGYAEALEMQADKQGAKYAKYTHAITDETQRMTKLVHDLLNLSNYESGAYVLNKRECRIDELIESIAEKHRTLNSGIKIETHVTPHTVIIDPDRIEQVITNLLSNALSHVDEAKRISIAGSVTTAGYRVSVYNSGEHIKESDAVKLWTPFYRADDSRKRESGRYGIGLSIVKALLELHKANYGVQNVDGGVEFYFEVKNPRPEKQ